MYCITEQQIEYILNDIRRNGVEKEDLQLNLLDHICCILEQELKENDDFETFYHQTIPRFYKTGLREIEEETINLLTFKNYYAMKKLMIISGAISVAAFFAGSFFKIMYWPGAGALLTLAMLVLGLVFLPLMVIFKAKEVSTVTDKLVNAIGAFVGILFCLSTLFKVQHWPGANVLIYSTIMVSVFIYIPTNFFTGIRRPDKKLNTIVTSVLWVGATGLLFTMMSLRPPVASPLQVEVYYQNESLLHDMQHRSSGKDTTGPEAHRLADEINNKCEQLKRVVTENAAGATATPEQIRKGNTRFFDRSLSAYFWEEAGNGKLLTDLKTAVSTYNAAKAHGSAIPSDLPVLNIDPAQSGIWANMGLLVSLNQLQMYLVNAEHTRQDVVASN